VVDAAIDRGVEKVLLISTDKAAQPVNLYGATKLCAEKLFVSGNSYTKGKTKFSCVRYGNVLGSRGSIVETLINNCNIEKAQITDLEMTRFWITLEQAFNLVMFALENMEGGEIFIPKIPSMKLVDLFEAIVPGIEREIIGIRPGEKLHEVLLTEQEARHSLSLKNYYVILPEFMNDGKYKKYKEGGEVLEKDFRFTSHANEDWLEGEKLKIIIDELRKIL
jgi:UDP-N-acetylglucosamine 4,6-dehydratase